MVLGQEGRAGDVVVTLEGRPSVWATAWVSCGVSLRPCGGGEATAGQLGGVRCPLRCSASGGLPWLGQAAGRPQERSQPRRLQVTRVCDKETRGACSWDRVEGTSGSNGAQRVPGPGAAWAATAEAL